MPFISNARTSTAALELNSKQAVIWLIVPLVMASTLGAAFAHLSRFQANGGGSCRAGNAGWIFMSVCHAIWLKALLRLIRHNMWSATYWQYNKLS